MSDVATHRLTPPPPTSRVTSTLANSRLGVMSVMFFALAGVAPLMVSSGVTTAAFATTGLLGIPVVFLAVAAFLAVFTVGYLAMSRHTKSSGAFYTFISRGLGRPAGVAGALVALVSYNLLQVSLYGAWGFVVSLYADARFGLHLPWWGWAMMAWLLVLVLGPLGIRLNARILTILTGAEVLLVLILDAVMVSHPAGGQITFTTLDPRLLVSPGMSAGYLTAIAGFIGFEMAAVLVEETNNPAKTTRRAMYTILAATGLLYAGTGWAMSVATGPDNIVTAAREQSSDLIFNLTGPYLPAVFSDLGHILFCTSVLAALFAFHQTVARYVFNLGRERVLPATAGYASAASGAPTIGSLFQSLIGFAAITLFALAGWDPFIQMFFWLGTTGGLGVLLLMVATCVSVVAYFLRESSSETVWTRLIAPILSGAVLSVIAYLVITRYETLLGVDKREAVVWAFPALYGVAAVIGVLWALGLRTARRESYKAIGWGTDV